MEGGKIIRTIGGKSIKEANYIRLEATDGNLTFNAATKVEMIGEKFGVKHFNDYTPPEPLLIVKLEGPLDSNMKPVAEPILGNRYWFRAYTNFIPEFWQKGTLKWAKKTNYEIQNIPDNFTFPAVEKNDYEKGCVTYSRLLEYQEMRLYAYFEKPIDRVSILCRGKNRFHYKGVKKWGRLQKYDEKGNLDFSAINTKVTEKELKANLNATGRQNVEILKGYGEKWIKWFYEYAAGTRQVLSDDDDIENKVINNFYTGRLSKLSFDENSKQSQKLHSYPYFQKYFQNYLEVIKILLKEKTIEKKDGKDIADIFVKQLNLDDFKPNFSIISDIYSYDYYGFMGGTQTIKVELEIEEIEDKKYRVKTKMYIGDWYGADWGDINGGSLQDFINQCDIDWSSPVESLKRIKDFGRNYFRKHVKGSTPSLNAFFWLQHYYGCHPFESEIIYQDTSYISL